MNFTQEQQTICEAARDAGSSLKIQAFAGTGKTTTLAAIARSLPQRRFLYLAFNRAAAEEAEKRSEPHQEKVEHVRSYNRTLAEGESLCY